MISISYDFTIYSAFITLNRTCISNAKIKFNKTSQAFKLKSEQRFGNRLKNKKEKTVFEKIIELFYLRPIQIVRLMKERREVCLNSINSKRRVLPRRKDLFRIQKTGKNCIFPVYLWHMKFISS